jgi:hypothetical protein
MAQAVFDPHLFPYKYPKHFSNLVHSTHAYLPMKMEQTECSETSAYKIRTPGNYPEESIQYSEHDEILKSRIVILTHLLYLIFYPSPLFVAVLINYFAAKLHDGFA